jgi:hypothetical protein
MRARTVAILPPSLDEVVNAVLVELERFAQAAEKSGSLAAATLRAGLSEAAQFKTNRPAWPAAAD